MGKNILVWLWLAGVLVLGTASTAAAVTHTVPLSGLGYDSDLVVKGAETYTEVFLPLPKADYQPSSSVNLYLEPSPYLNPQSVFTVFLNDQPAGMISAGQLKGGTPLRYPLPAGATEAQGVKIAVRTNMYETQDICGDYARGHLFYTLKNNTRLQLAFQPVPVRTVGDFFAGLFQGVAVVLPAKPGFDEMTAAAWVYALVQKTYPHLPVRIMFAGETSPLPQIWVANRNHLPLHLLQPQSNVYVANSQTLVITADQDDQLKNTVRQLAFMEALRAAPSASLVLGQMPAPAAPAPADKLHFGNATAREGTGMLTLDFSLFPALLSTPPQSLSIYLAGKYTPVSASQRSARMDVYFNRILVYSEILDNSGEIRARFNLPGVGGMLSKNNLSVQFRYEDNSGKSCDVKGPVNSAQIFTSSYAIGQKSADPSRLTWKNVGIYFNQGGLIFVDDQLNRDLIRSAALLTLFINRQLPEKHFVFPEFLPLSRFRETGKAGFLAVLAAAGSVPEEMQKDLPLRIGADATVYNGEGQSLVFRYQAELPSVMAQLGQYKGIPLMIFAANVNTSALPDALYRLASLRYAAEREGNLYVFDGNGRFFSNRPSLPEVVGDNMAGTIWERVAPGNLWEQLQRWVQSHYKLAAGLAALLLALAAGSNLIGRKKR